MSNISFDISGKLETSYIDALLAIKEIADHLIIPFFIVGATARDISLEYLHHIKAPRMTTDIDLGVKVSDWGKFKALTDSSYYEINFLGCKVSRQNDAVGQVSA